MHVPNMAPGLDLCGYDTQPLGIARRSEIVSEEQGEQQTKHEAQEPLCTDG